MSRLYGRETRLKITGELRIGKNARIVTEQSDGTEVNTAASAVPTLAAGAATDEMDITIAVRDGAGNVIPGVHHLDVWITDDLAALSLTATAASGALTAIDGSILHTKTAKKHVEVLTPASGIINLSLVDSANTAGEAIVVYLPGVGNSVSAATVAGDYEGG
jgi:hypothetical protein